MTVPDSKWMQDIAERMAHTDESLRIGDDRMARIEKQLDANTLITTEVRDLMIAARGFWSFVMGVGKLGAAAGALYGLWYSLTHGGKPPGG